MSDEEVTRQAESAGGESSGNDAEVATKMKVAIEIYKRMQRRKQVTRKEVIEQFVAEAGLSKNGASTYYQLIKRKLSK